MVRKQFSVGFNFSLANLTMMVFALWVVSS
jgi:hypothetical protein